MRCGQRLRAASTKAARRRSNGIAPGGGGVRTTTQDRSDGADLLEVGVPGEIVAARPRRCRRRKEAGAALDELSGRDDPFANRDADSMRPGGLRQPLDGRHPQHHPSPVGPLVHALDETGDRGDQDPDQDGPVEGAHAQDGRTEPCEDRREGEAGREAGEIPAQTDGGGRAHAEAEHRSPEGRRAVGLKEQDDPEPERDGDPRKQATLVDLPPDAALEPTAPVGTHRQPRPRAVQRPRHGPRGCAGHRGRAWLLGSGHRFGLTSGINAW